MLDILATAVISSALTVGLLTWWINRTLWPRLRDELDEGLRELDERIDEAREDLDETIVRAGRELEASVKRGVREGLLEGVAEIPSARVVKGATMSAARVGVDLMTEGMGRLGLGRRPPRRDDDEGER